MKLIDISGNQYGRWTVLARATPSKWFCRCACGTEKQIAGSSLKNGDSGSCGCLSSEMKRARIVHGHARVCGHSSEYDVWSSMRGRCSQIDDPRYGGRGISVCDEWSDFSVFLRDMGKRPSSKHSIERVNNDLGYSKSNCRWATFSEQQRNKRSNHYVEIGGERVLLIEAAQRSGIGYKLAWQRVVDLGWPVEKALSTPSRGRAY